MLGGRSHIPVSWSDHWEDVRLWRVLSRLNPGYYVDVGAMDPSAESVTKVAYERGWRGVHVEPNPYFADRLRRERPQDRVEEVAAGASSGQVSLNLVLDAAGEQTGLSTLDGQVAERHRAAGSRIETREVRILPLQDLMIGTPAEDPQRFHFLKVDVEGSEAEVLRGSNLARFRPLMIVVEARAPRRDEDTYAESESILEEALYSLAADDGLNRWYVRSEDFDLAPLLAPEVNPLTDGKPRRWWEVAREHELVTRMDELDAAATKSAGDAETLREEVERLRGETADLRCTLDAVYRSRSWRITGPMRAMQRAVKRK
jgi:FkbM family methyltransferase